MIRAYAAFDGQDHCTRCAGAGKVRGQHPEPTVGPMLAVPCPACEGSGRNLEKWERGPDQIVTVEEGKKRRAVATWRRKPQKEPRDFG